MLNELLKDLGNNYPLTNMTDHIGMNLFHHAVLKGIEGKTQLLIDFVV